MRIFSLLIFLAFIFSSCNIIEFNHQYRCCSNSNTSVHDTIFQDGDTLVKSIYVPNIFSPNNDGINDVFYIVGSCIDTSFLVIRKGLAKVFESSNAHIYPNGWNGVINGERVESGVFQLYLFAKTCDGVGYNISGELCVGNCIPNNVSISDCQFGNQHIDNVYNADLISFEIPCE